MVSMRLGASIGDVTNELVEQAAALWGRERAEAIRESLEQTARHLLNITQNLPDQNVEPSFYQYP